MRPLAELGSSSNAGQGRRRRVTCRYCQGASPPNRRADDACEKSTGRRRTQQRAAHGPLGNGPRGKSLCASVGTKTLVAYTDVLGACRLFSCAFVLSFRFRRRTSLERKRAQDTFSRQSLRTRRPPLYLTCNLLTKTNGPVVPRQIRARWPVVLRECVGNCPYYRGSPAGPSLVGALS